ncbi:UBX domain-containing protein 1-A [Ciona intestinalis]
MSGVETLVEMGFLRNRAEKAWLKMGDRGVQAAMEWLLEHNEDPDIDEPYQPPQGRTLTSENESNTPLDTQPSSEGDVAEAKPVLTEEEREERLKQIQGKIKQRRLETEAEEKKRQIEAEIQRRKSGQDISKIKADTQWKEAQKQAEARKREKREDMIARQRVKEQIAMDRAEKQAREEKEKQERMQTSSGVTALSTGTAATSTSVTSIKKEHTHTRLQIRLPNGGTLVEKFSAKEQLAAVKLYIELNRKDGDVTPFMLITAFPKKRFTEEEMNMSLESLDLAPSAVLTVVNKVQ